MENSYIAMFIGWLAARYQLTLFIVVAISCWALQAIGKWLEIALYEA